MMALEYIQFGCGLCVPPGWINFDASPTLWLQKYLPFTTPILVRKGYPAWPTRNILYGDIVRGLPVGAQSARGVYCSHIIEHLSLQEMRISIRNVLNYLQPGGHFRMVLPDLECLAREYLADDSSQAASHFMEAACLGSHGVTSAARSLMEALFSRNKHLWMWDDKGLAKELADAGFVDVRRASFNDSDEPRFKEVEELERWNNCLGMECRRPG
jgi:predicted SAM-dependent methyltransferase